MTRLIFFMSTKTAPLIKMKNEKSLPINIFKKMLSCYSINPLVEKN